MEAAVVALKSWKQNYPESEPEGWMRNPRTGRRRPDGDPTKEYVYF